ncbi:acyl-CoA N-acyltransferase [Annulohypoxylon bovei var. microspora]|nr:acyl-CoA N-acyltransferase [Annulohypoxylon bovei var. microspora]
MASWKIEGCTVADAAAMARNNMSAFWEDPTWVLLWPKDITREFMIEQGAKRYARSLLRDRGVARHQKAVDPATGALVGYARWILPSGRSTAMDGSAEWAEAQVPDVGGDERRRFEELAESAWWNGRKEMKHIDDKNDVVMDRILSAKPYIKLEYLAVHPENKGKGIATALVEGGIKFAEEIGVPVFVMSYKAGRGVYERLGFKEVDRVIQDDTEYGGKGEYGAYFMIYDMTTSTGNVPT